MEENQVHLNKVKLLLSYGGKIQARPSDRHLTYVGGDTKILALDRNANFSQVVSKLKSLGCCGGAEDHDDVASISVKYQLPGFDLDALISLTDDDDVEHMMVEYDRMQRIIANDDGHRPTRLRLFVFDTSVPKQAPSPTPNPDYLFGFDKDYQTTGTDVVISGPPPLDLLQIPGVAVPEGHVSGSCLVDVALGLPEVCRIPTVVGNREQSVYGTFVPVVNVMPAKKGMVGNVVAVEGKVGQT